MEPMVQAEDEKKDIKCQPQGARGSLGNRLPSGRLATAQMRDYKMRTYIKEEHYTSNILQNL